MDPITMAISGGASLISGLFGAARARKAARRARKESAALERRISNVEANRQDVIDPYANVKDLSGMISNPFQNLQVATEAAEMRAREQDLSLASTLDTLRATGASAGGATALAQAASRSKANIAADIAKQEAQNTRLRAQGEQQMQQLQLREAGRVQQARAQGAAFKFGAQEKRDNQLLNRLAAKQQNAANQATQYQNQSNQMFGQALGGAFGVLGGLYASSRDTEDSDRRLKQDIKFLRLSPSGLKIYSFKYKNQDGIYEGVMSDEIPNYAVVKNFKGIYDGVDYSKIDVKFKRVI